MNIYAPSYKRAKGVKTHRIIPSIIYCVHEFEAQEYIDEGYKVEIMPDDIRGNIARVRNYMLKHYIKDKGLIIDDDIEALKFWSTEDGLPKSKNIEDVAEFIEQGFNLCEEFGARLWGVNIIGDKGSYREYTPFALKSTISASFMGFLNNELIFDERLPLKEDYDYCIQNCNVYRKLLRINSVFMVKKDHGNKGGCADYRTMSREVEQLKLLQNKWGNNIVKNDTTQRGAKIKGFDLNPIVRIPINGI